jgi:hypothetical protein
MTSHRTVVFAEHGLERELADNMIQHETANDRFRTGVLSIITRRIK